MSLEQALKRHKGTFITSPDGNTKYLVQYKNAHEYDWYEVTNQGYQHMINPPRWYYDDIEFYFMSILSKIKKEIHADGVIR
jgi:hypothetical protein